MAFTPLDKYSGYIWFNGDLLKWEDAKTHLLTHSLHYSGAVYEGERSYNGKIFKLQEHTERLLASAKVMHLEHKFTADDIIKAHELLIEKNNLTDSYIRPLLFRGSESLNITNLNLSTNLLIVAIPLAEKSEQSSHLHLSRWVKAHPNSLPPQVKSSGHYNMMIVAQTEAKAAGFDDALLTDWRGFVAEATTSNVFFVKDNNLVTPIADSFLNGITRQTVIEIATNLGIGLEEKYIKLEEIKEYQECFLTGTAAEVKKVNSITLNDQRVIFAKNEIMELIREKYMKLIYGD